VEGVGLVDCWLLGLFGQLQVPRLQHYNIVTTMEQFGIQGVYPVPVQYMLLEGATMVLICLYYLIPSDHRII
jgi:hypothetical protein